MSPFKVLKNKLGKTSSHMRNYTTARDFLVNSKGIKVQNLSTCDSIMPVLPVLHHVNKMYSTLSQSKDVQSTEGTSQGRKKSPLSMRKLALKHFEKITKEEQK